MLSRWRNRVLRYSTAMTRLRADTENTLCAARKLQEALEPVPEAADAQEARSTAE